MSALFIMMEIRIMICLRVFHFLSLSREAASVQERNKKKKRELVFSEHLLNAAGFCVKGSHEIATSCTEPVPLS